MRDAYVSDLARKLNVRTGMRVHVIGAPAGVVLEGITASDAVDADGVLVFVETLADVDATSGPFIDAARRDQLAWIAYPKAGQLGTDLNRDVLWRHLAIHGIRGVRQIAIDDVWSAMRFRPGT